MFYLIHVAVLSLSKKSAHNQKEELERIDRYKERRWRETRGESKEKWNAQFRIRKTAGPTDQNYQASRKIEVKAKTKTEEYLSRVVLHSRGRGS